MFVKPHQWPTPSESIAIYCVRKLVSCVTHHQSCAKVDIWNKKKKLRTVAKIKTQNYLNWRLQKFSTIATLPLNTATTLFNEPRSQRPLGTILLYRNWSVNLFNQITRLSVNLFNNWSVSLFNQFARLVGVPDFLRCTLRSIANHVIAWDKKPRQKRWVCVVSQK